MFASLAVILMMPGLLAASEAPAGRSRGGWEGTDRLLDESARELGIQTDLPDADISGILELPRWLRSLAEISQGSAKAMFYLAVTFIAVMLLVSLRDNLWSASRARRFESSDGVRGSPDVAARRMESAQATADELARRGEFRQAMHVLLLQSVSELRGVARISISDSSTSREILRRVTRYPECGAVFADIVRMVEVSYFGTHVPDADEYSACRRSFDALTGLIRRKDLA
jgi:hypothetical protein